MTTPTQKSPSLPSAEVAQQLALGRVLLQRGQVSDAVKVAEGLADRCSGVPEVYVFAANAFEASRDFERALQCLDEARKYDDDPHLLIRGAWVRSGLRRREGVLGLLAQAAASPRSARDAVAQHQLGRLYSQYNRMVDAISHFERALALAPGRLQIRYDLAIARLHRGDIDAALADLDQALANAPQSGSLLYLRSTARRQTAASNHVQDLEQRLQQPFPRQEDEAGAMYALAKELEDLEQHDAAFDTLERAAKAKRRTLKGYDVGRELDSMREIRASATPEVLGATSAGCREAGAVFIVGMPRTGTTLVARLLSQSGRVGNAGEPTDFGALVAAAMPRSQNPDTQASPTRAALGLDLEALGTAYMRSVRELAGGSPAFIDKLPNNFMHCGLIHKALPNAKIIHVVRDPLDSCYAIFKTQFFKAYEFSCDLDELAQYYLAYHELMRHWHQVVPGTILDVHYEALVTDTEAQARRIYDWCGLEWTPTALETPQKRSVYTTASAAQVREPVHARSVHSARRHLAKLEPLVSRLVDAGVMKRPEA